VGHYVRHVPEGYLRRRDSKTHPFPNDALEEYYQAIELITKAPLWEEGRLMHIIRFNLGQYDALRDTYVTSTITPNET
jgi:hypothetical protein